MSLARRTFLNDAREVRRMSEWWREWAASAALAPEIRDIGELCLNEAAGNIVQHGRSATRIDVQLLRTDESVSIVLADDGAAFDPSTAARRGLPRDLEETEPGGLGLNILDLYATSTSYRRDEDVNVLTLTFAPRT